MASGSVAAAFRNLGGTATVNRLAAAFTWPCDVEFFHILTQFLAQIAVEYGHTVLLLISMTIILDTQRVITLRCRQYAQVATSGVTVQSPSKHTACMGTNTPLRIPFAGPTEREPAETAIGNGSAPIGAVGTLGHEQEAATVVPMLS